MAFIKLNKFSILCYYLSYGPDRMFFGRHLKRKVIFHPDGDHFVKQEELKVDLSKIREQSGERNRMYQEAEKISKF